MNDQPIEYGGTIYSSEDTTSTPYPPPPQDGYIAQSPYPPPQTAQYPYQPQVPGAPYPPQPQVAAPYPPQPQVIGGYPSQLMVGAPPGATVVVVSTPQEVRIPLDIGWGGPQLERRFPIELTGFVREAEHLEFVDETNDYLKENYGPMAKFRWVLIAFFCIPALVVPLCMSLFGGGALLFEIYGALLFFTFGIRSWPPNLQVVLI